MRKFRADPLIFFSAVGFIVAFVALTIGFGENARNLYSTVSAWMMDNFAWLYIGGVSTVFIFLIVLFRLVLDALCRWHGRDPVVLGCC